MSGPKCNEVRVISEAERRRQEDERRRHKCDGILTDIQEINSKLFIDLKVDVVDNFTDNHDGLIKKEKYLNNLRGKAKEQLRKQNEILTRCDLLVKEIDKKRINLTRPGDYEPIKPKVKTFKDYENWENELNEIMTNIEIQSEKDAVLLKHTTKKRLDTGGVELSDNKVEQLRQERLNRRRVRLDTIASKICTIEDDRIRESFVIETRPLLDLENDQDFDDAVIDLNTKVRNEQKIQDFRNEAFEVVSQISYLDTKIAIDVQNKAKTVKSDNEVQEIKEIVSEIINKEKEKQDRKYISKALCETLKELGYDYGEEFEKTEFGSFALAQKADNDKHAIRVQLNNEGTEVFTRIVSLTETTPEQDKLAEEKMCDDCHGIRKGLNKRGCEAKLTREVAPGESKVENIDKIRKNKARRARQRRQATSVSRRRTL